MPRVLLVEDEEPLQRILARNLTRRGYDVTVESSAAAAIASLCAGPLFDALLLDVNLPDRTGWDVLRAMSGCDMPPVIVLTALRPMQRRLDEFRPAAVLLKPFPVDALVRLVGRVTRMPRDTPTPGSQQ
jgi:DNA-binding response OmpR family regulator